MSFTLEIIAFDIESCRTIGRAGAHRIEFGAITPEMAAQQLPPE